MTNTYTEKAKATLEEMGLHQSEILTLKNHLEASRFPATYAYDQIRTMKLADSRGDACDYLKEKLNEESMEVTIGLAFAYIMQFSKEYILEDLLTLDEETILKEVLQLKKIDSLVKETLQLF